MATTIQKITLSASRDIPFNKLLLSQANVRRVKAGVSIEELAEDIARRTLLQGLSVRAVLDADGNETGMFEVPAGGRRFRALELLVKQKRLAKTASVPCVVRDGGIAEEDSLAENVQRVALLDYPPTKCLLAGLSGCAADVGSSVPAALARTTLEAAATPQACQRGAALLGQHPCHVANGRARGEPLALR
jgi:ParB-like nuclease domain